MISAQSLRKTHYVISLGVCQLTHQSIERPVGNSVRRAPSVYGSFVSFEDRDIVRTYSFHLPSIIVPVLRRNTVTVSSVEEEDEVAFVDLCVLDEVTVERSQNVVSRGRLVQQNEHIARRDIERLFQIIVEVFAVIDAAFEFSNTGFAVLVDGDNEGEYRRRDFLFGRCLRVPNDDFIRDSLLTDRVGETYTRSPFFNDCSAFP